MPGFPSASWYYAAPQSDTFECARCDAETDERDRSPETSLCRPCDRFEGFLNTLHTARYRRAAQRAIGPNIQPIAQGDTVMDPNLLNALLANLDPFTAGAVIDGLERLGLLPETATDPDRTFVVIDQDPPPTVAVLGLLPRRFAA